MSSLGIAMNTALRALQANQFGLAVSSNNIANANTPGYSKQRVMLQPSAGTGGELSIGTGVDVMGTEALRDRFIQQRFHQETSRQTESDSTHQSLTDIEMLFNEADQTGMLPALTNFFNSFHALSADPTSPQRRQELITNAGVMIDSFHARHAELRSLQAVNNRSISDDVAQINSFASRIAQLTQEITQQEASEPANELRDQRELLVRELSAIVEVRQVESADSYQLSIGSNRPLVVNSTAFPITAASASGTMVVRSGQEDITAEISGGKIGSHIALRDDYIPRYLTALNQLAFEIGEQVNQIHQAGYDLDGNTGIDFFTPQADATDAAYSLSLSTDISSSHRKVAASGQSSGVGNEKAIAIGNLLHTAVFSGGSVTEQYGSLAFSIGSDTAAANLAQRQHESLAGQLENRIQALSGVSIDEETMNILQFQRAFEASARVVRVIDELLQVTLSLGAQ